jgi:hypothetical protein
MKRGRKEVLKQLKRENTGKLDSCVNLSWRMGMKGVAKEERRHAI